MGEREAWEKHLEQIPNLNARDQVRAAGWPYFSVGYRRGWEDALEEAEALLDKCARAEAEDDGAMDAVFRASAEIVRALRREREGLRPSHIEVQTAVSPEAIDEQLAARNRRLIDEVNQAEAQGLPVRRPTPEEAGDG